VGTTRVTIEGRFRGTNGNSLGERRRRARPGRSGSCLTAQHCQQGENSRSAVRRTKSALSATGAGTSS
jgi:hypothetical protein